MLFYRFLLWVETTKNDLYEYFFFSNELSLELYKWKFTTVLTFKISHKLNIRNVIKQNEMSYFQKNRSTWYITFEI